VLPLKFGDFLLDFILVLSNVSGIFMETENYRYPQCVYYPCQNLQVYTLQGWYQNITSYHS
jgi:hypothetical protein